MKLISYDSARVTWLFPLEELLPLQIVRDRSPYAELVAKYKFASLPNVAVSVEEFRQNGFRFGSGQFEQDGHIGAINEFWVYNDGIVAVASTTDIARLFLIDIVGWLQAELSFRDVSSIRELYLSNVVVEFERPMSRLIGAYEAITNAISTKVGPLFRTSDTVGLARLDFEFDRTSDNLKLAAPRFTLERRANVPFDQERYFASAPLSTSDHLSVLETIEQQFAAG